MIALPLKHTQPTDWVGPLRAYLSGVYGSASEFASEISSFNTMRQDISDPPRGANGRDLLYRYYGQLELLDMRIPINERGCRVKFEWKNLFDDEVVVQQSSAFEKAGVLFNLGAVYSHIGAAGDPKAAYAAFQAAAGIFKFVSESFLHAPSADYAAETANTLSGLMLAQAQHAFVIKAVDGAATKSGLIAKLAKSAADKYKDASEQLEGLFSNENWGEADWHETCATQAQTLLATAHMHMALHLDNSKKYGPAIAHMREARRLFKELPESKQQYELTSEKVKVMEKDNDLIYHEVISAVLEDIPAMDAAKPTSMDKLYGDQAAASRVVGRDLFSRVIPLDVHERASMYSEEKAQLLRKEQEKVDVADEELKSALEFMDLPRSASMLRHPDQSAEDISGVPGLVKEWAQEIATSPLEFDLATRRQRLLDRLQIGIEPHSAQRAKQSLLAAVATDKQLQASWDAAKTDVEILSQGFGAGSPLTRAFIFQATSAISLLDLDDSERATVNDALDRVLNDVVKLQKIHNERRNVFAEFKEKVHADDISDKLVVHRKTRDIEQALFKPELAKFSPYIQRVDSTIRHQTGLLNELSTLWKQTLTSPLIRKQAADRENVLAQRVAAIERFRHAYQTWLGVREGLDRAHKFYNELEASLVPDMGGLTLQSPRPVPPTPMQSQPQHPPPMPPKPTDFSGYSMPSAYDASLYRR